MAAQLRRLGVDVEVRRRRRGAPLEDDDLFSYRREGDAAGRLGRADLDAAVTRAAGTELAAATWPTVRDRIAAACDAAGRDPDDVTLIVVTKFFPASDVRLLAELGVRHVGENRHQEARGEGGRVRRPRPARGTSSAACRATRPQRSRRTPTSCDSVDRAKLLRGLSSGVRRSTADRSTCLVQVSLDPDPRRRRPGRARGAAPADVPALAEQVAQTDGLRLRGVMAVAPLGAGSRGRRSRSWPRSPPQVRLVDPAATWISAGMSGDLEAASQRCDTRADRQRGPRYEAIGTVVSTQ